MLERRALALEAQAAIRVKRDRAAVEVWVRDPATNRSVLRQVFVPDGEVTSDAVVATRAVELLRATFLEIDVEMPTPAAPQAALGNGKVDEPEAKTPPAPTTTKPMPTTAVVVPARPMPRENARDVQRVVADAEPRFYLGAGLLGQASPGGLPTSGHLSVDFAWYATRRLFLALSIVPPGLAGSVERDEGTASVQMSMGVVELGVQIVPGPFSPTVGAGAGLVWLSTSGSANAPYEGRSDDAWGAVALGKVGARWRLSRTMVVDADTRVGRALPRRTVRFAEQQVAKWGGLVALFGLRAEVGFD